MGRLITCFVVTSIVAVYEATKTDAVALDASVWVALVVVCTLMCYLFSVLASPSLKQ